MTGGSRVYCSEVYLQMATKGRGLLGIVGRFGVCTGFGVVDGSLGVLGFAELVEVVQADQLRSRDKYSAVVCLDWGFWFGSK